MYNACHHNMNMLYVSLILQWRHNERDGASNHRHLDCFFSRLCRHISKKTSKVGVTGLCEGNPLVIGGSPHKGPVKCLHLMTSTWSENVPAGTRRNNNVFITSKRRRWCRFDVMKTLSLRHYCNMCPLGYHRSRIDKLRFSRFLANSFAE